VLDAQASVTDAGAVYQKSGGTGDLYYRNGAGTEVQLTSGSSINTSSGNQGWSRTAPAGDLSISNVASYVAIEVDTTAPRTITLPAAASVAAGRRYVISDKTGTANTNPITIARTGGDTIDGATSHTVRSSFGRCVIWSDGVSAWECFDVWNAEQGAINFDGMTIAAADFLTINAVSDLTLGTGGNMGISSDGGTSILAEADIAIRSNADNIAITADQQVSITAGGDVLALVSQAASVNVTAASEVNVDATAGDINLTSAGGDVALTPAVGTGRVNVSGPSTTTAPSAGAGDALPATPTGYLTIKVNGTSRKIAYY
jgi:uncharacterized protein (DUF2345 family)